MERLGMIWHIRPGHEEEYDRRHAAVWSELEDSMREFGARELVLFRAGSTVFAYLEVDEFQRFAQRYADDPVADRWEREIDPLIHVHSVDPETGWPTRLAEVWRLSSRAERGGA